jgi:hypothetical protein
LLSSSLFSFIFFEFRCPYVSKTQQVIFFSVPDIRRLEDSPLAHSRRTEFNYGTINPSLFLIFDFTSFQMTHPRACSRRKENLPVPIHLHIQAWFYPEAVRRSSPIIEIEIITEFFYGALLNGELWVPRETVGARIRPVVLGSRDWFAVRGDR